MTHTATPRSPIDGDQPIIAYETFKGSGKIAIAVYETEHGTLMYEGKYAAGCTQSVSHVQSVIESIKQHHPRISQI